MSAKKRADEGDSAAQLEACLAKFDDAVAALAREALARMRALAPGAVELVYDAYNALSIPFGSSERLGDAFVSVVVYPKHVNLGFLRGAELPDPHGLLEGEGTKIRHVRVDAERLASPEVAALVREAAKLAGFKATKGAAGRIVVKKIYPKQRPRKPRSTRASS